MTTRQAGGIALVLLVLSALLTGTFRSIELVEERRRLTELRETQESAVRAAATVRRQFGTLAAGITALAAAGDDSAKTILDDMRRQGILPAPKP